MATTTFYPGKTLSTRFELPVQTLAAVERGHMKPAAGCSTIENASKDAQDQAVDELEAEMVILTDAYFLKQAVADHQGKRPALFISPGLRLCRTGPGSESVLLRSALSTPALA